MKVKDLIEILSKENPDTEVNLMNGVGAYSPMYEEDIGWATLRPYPYGIAHGPPNQVYVIYGE